jgi:methionyl-tRNA formyltransferase
MAPLLRIVFFGTPEFAVPTLEALVARGRVVAVVTQQPRPTGRGQRLQEPPVALRASQHGIPVLQPERVSDPGFLGELRRLAPDVAVVVAFGQIFPAELLALPPQGCINLHASVLPKYRGAAPIQAALLAGERTTGITTMGMEERLDAGPILKQEETEIGATETAGQLSERLARLGAQAVVQTLDGLEAGTLEPEPQGEAGVSYARRIRKEDGRLDWSLEAGAIFNRLRAYTPWPGVFTTLREHTVKILWGVPLQWRGAPAGGCGSFVGLHQQRMAVLCGQGTVFGVEEVQRAGKRPVPAADFVNGERLEAGERFD